MGQEIYEKMRPKCFFFFCTLHAGPATTVVKTAWVGPMMARSPQKKIDDSSYCTLQLKVAGKNDESCYGVRLNLLN